MMQFDRMTLGKKARELGFVRDTFEKVCRLADVLDFIQKDELLSNALALKGGTAINLTIFNLPRLSVDIDMDFSENVPREEMLAIRKQITERISKYMTAAGYHLSQKSKTYHALDSFVYEYQNTGGMKDNLKIEINYMLRCHVLAPVRRTVNLPWLEQELTVLSVDPLEIYGSKIVALLNRAAPRDLYDIHTMMEYGLFDESQEPMLKKCVMFYSAIGSDNVPDRFHFEQIASVSQQRVKTDLSRFSATITIKETHSGGFSMIRDICKDEFFLSQKAEPATADDLSVAQDLLDTLTAHKDGCVGMAANMIGVNKRIIAFDNIGEYMVMFNPVIVKKSAPYDAEEGCLSLTGTRKTKRYQTIKVQWQNEQFQTRIKTFTGWTAQIIQHEIDHCEGIII